MTLNITGKGKILGGYYSVYIWEILEQFGINDNNIDEVDLTLLQNLENILEELEKEIISDFRKHMDRF